MVVALCGCFISRALARLLEVDAVVVGAITDYDPYYPPRIGMHVEWFSPQPSQVIESSSTVAEPKLLPDDEQQRRKLLPSEMLQPDIHKPLMSHTRMFDGSDADLVDALRDYVKFNGDRRSGGWEAYLHRSEDFIRFTAHRMIAEMFKLHGGKSKRRIVLNPSSPVGP